jgi:hypothetical protein
MAIPGKSDPQTTPVESEVQPHKEEKQGQKNSIDPSKHNSNSHNEQGQHGSGEGLTGMQPGAGHPRGR